ncbi:aminoglycoside 6-adenylyltransferase [Bacillus cereus]|nr:MULTISPECIES: aminoglycoside 6-adenylyltransferase [Paenibacillus]MEB9894081.1 aminoglycoside 6-adenylyltransferase [Bacillus cereus]
MPGISSIPEPNAEYENIWESLFVMCKLFEDIAVQVADDFGYKYPADESEKVTAYLRHVRLLPDDAAEIYEDI